MYNPIVVPVKHKQKHQTFLAFLNALNECCLSSLCGKRHAIILVAKRKLISASKVVAHLLPFYFLLYT